MKELAMLAVEQEQDRLPHPMMVYFSLHRGTVMQDLLFRITYGFNKLQVLNPQQHWNAMDVVYTHTNGHSLYVGRIPNHRLFSQIARNGVSHIFSCVDYREYLVKDSLPHPQRYIEAGMQHYMIPMRDFSADIHPAVGAKAVLTMAEALGRGSVYIHCKAGRSRSAMMAAVLLVFLGVYPNVPEAEAGMRQYRKQIQLGAAKTERGGEILKLLKAGAVAPAVERLMPLVQLPSFKRFMLLVTASDSLIGRSRARVQCVAAVQQFLDAIMNDDATWYRQLSDVVTGAPGADHWPLSGCINVRPAWWRGTAGMLLDRNRERWEALRAFKQEVEECGWIAAENL